MNGVINMMNVCDELGLIEDNLKKAYCLIEEIGEVYFNQAASDPGDIDPSSLITDFRRYGTYARIVEDYIFGVGESVKALIDKTNEAHNISMK